MSLELRCPGFVCGHGRPRTVSGSPPYRLVSAPTGGYAGKYHPARLSPRSGGTGSWWIGYRFGPWRHVSCGAVRT